MSYTEDDVELVANAYHWAARNSCGPDDCPGVPECIYAEHLDWGAFRASVRALAAAGRLLPLEAETRRAIDIAHLAQQREWSRATFGPGRRTQGVVDHIRKELVEIEKDPADLLEWVDVIILAFDGAWRAGWEPQEIIDAIKVKQAVNEARDWPDWRTHSEDVAIEHVRSVQGVTDGG